MFNFFKSSGNDEQERYKQEFEMTPTSRNPLAQGNEQLLSATQFNSPKTRQFLEILCS